MTRHLMLIGGGRMQIPVLEAARELGLLVHCLDARPDAPAASLADWFTVCDISDREACLDRAREHRQRHRLDAVVTAGTDFSTTVSWIADALGLPGTPFPAALRAKDKGLMREAFDRAGVASPRYRVFTEVPGRVPDLGFGYPVVVKPADSMGARGVRLVAGPEGLLAALAEARGYSPEGRALAEEYIDGPEFSCDAIVRGGDFHRCGLADRTIVFPPAFVEIGHSFPSRAAPEVQEAVWAEFERGARALGITWGAAKGDIKFQPGRGPVMGEIANRLSGGYMSGWTYPLSSGRRPSLWAVQTALGDPLSPQPERAVSAVVERAWIGLPGRVAAVAGLDAVRALPGVTEVVLAVAAGAETRFPRNNVEKLGSLIVTGRDAAEAEARSRAALNTLVVTYQPGAEATLRFLEGGGPEPWWLPPARGLPDAGPAAWLTRARQGSWVDVYGNSLDDLCAQLAAEGLTPDSQGPGFWRSLLVGGLAGARYAGRR